MLHDCHPHEHQHTNDDEGQDSPVIEPQLARAAGGARKLWLRAIMRLKDVLSKQWPGIGIGIELPNDEEGQQT